MQSGQLDVTQLSTSISARNTMIPMAANHRVSCVTQDRLSEGGAQVCCCVCCRGGVVAAGRRTTAGAELSVVLRNAASTLRLQLDQKRSIASVLIVVVIAMAVPTRRGPPPPSAGNGTGSAPAMVPSQAKR